MTIDATKLPRIYTDQGLTNKAPIALDAARAHYLRNVLRKKPGDSVRVFNGTDGEFLAEISELGKKNGTLIPTEKIRDQPPQSPEIRLFFAPVKKQRMDMIVEKAVELSATDLHPVLTARTEVRKINAARIRAQITEAAEQCERLTLPRLHTEDGSLLPSLTHILGHWKNDSPLYACVERGSAPPLDEALEPGNAAFLIGPAGGFDDSEIALLKGAEAVRPVSLGDYVLRCETAAIVCLSLALLKNK